MIIIRKLYSEHICIEELLYSIHFFIFGMNNKKIEVNFMKNKNILKHNPLFLRQDTSQNKHEF